MNYESSLTSDAIRGIYDMGYRGIRKLVPGFPKIKERAKEQIQSFYKGTTKNGIVSYLSPSGTTAGRYWAQKIHLLDLDKLIQKYKDSKTPKEIVALAVRGNMKVYCNDPSFLYWGFKYISWTKGFGMFKEARDPKIRNPKHKGSVCKHLENALLTLPFHISNITRDLKKKGAFN